MSDGLYFEPHPGSIRTLPLYDEEPIMANETVFKRYSGNPIVTAKAVPRANSIHNSAIVRFGDGYAAVFRVDETNFNFTLHVGWSTDGIKWDINPDSIHMESDDPEI